MSHVCAREFRYLSDSAQVNESTRRAQLGFIDIVLILCNRTISFKRYMVRFLNQSHSSTLTLHLAVEYRLLQHAPVPGALQDAAAVYAHLVTHHLGASRGPDGKYHYPELQIPHHRFSDPPTLRDTVQGTSTSTIDLALDCETPQKSFAIPASTVVSPLTEAGYQQHPDFVQRHDNRRDSVTPVISGNDATPYSVVSPVYSTRSNSDPVAAALRPRIILIGDSAGGNLVLALARWIRDEGVFPVPDGMLLLSPSCDPCMHSQYP